MFLHSLEELMTATDGMVLIEQLSNIFAIQGYKTEILAASIRSPLHIVKAAEGSRCVHLSFGIYTGIT
jgi:hypothetical protein